MSQYLKLPGIVGYSKSSQWPGGWFPIASFSWGQSQASGAGGGGQTKADPKDIWVTIQEGVDVTTLFQAAATGKHFEWIKLALANEAQDQVIEYNFSDCVLSGNANSNRDGKLTISLGINFASVTKKFR